MKPPPFLYGAPESLDECVELLSHYSEDAKVLAGGQSLMPLLNLRMVRPTVIVDIARIPGLDQWAQEDGHIRIGALVRQSAFEDGGALAAAVPILAQAITFVGHPATRSRGTIVGSMCHADPAAELPVCAVLLGAEFLIRSKEGFRIVEANDFFDNALTTTVRSHEVVEAVRFPANASGAGYAFTEIGRRHGDFALVSVAALVEWQGDHVRARVALGGVGPRPISLVHEKFEPKRQIDSAELQAFSQYVATRIEPNTDLQATAEYRRAVSATLVERALCAAWQRADVRS
jgi:CO/xanthine dehydrogenase FAD-binding subunit